jgi:hypothetical protein
MSKILTVALVLTLTLMLPLAGCSNDGGSNDSGSGSKQPDQPQDGDKPAGSTSRY